MTHPMTPRQRAALIVIQSRQDAGDIGPTLDEIANALGVSKPRVVVIVTALEKRHAVRWPKSQGGRRLARSLRAVGGSAS